MIEPNIFKFSTVVEYHVTDKFHFFYYIIYIWSYNIEILLTQVHLNSFVPLIC